MSNVRPKLKLSALSETMPVVSDSGQTRPSGGREHRLSGSLHLVTPALFCLLVSFSTGCGESTPNEDANIRPDRDGIYHVFPGMRIQSVLDRAAADPDHKRVRVHGGTYRPQKPGAALIWLNSRHDGLTVEAEGEVILTAQNSDIAHKADSGYPAVVAHVVYFGDGISKRTIFRGFRVTGANNFVAPDEDAHARVIEPHLGSPGLRSGLFFKRDGGGIKIFGRSYPQIENVVVYDNYASPCGGGVSVEHRGFNSEPVTFRNCVFQNNRCQVTGSAIDALQGSAVFLENCLFVGNLSNRGHDYVGGPNPANGYKPQHGSGALTVFGQSTARVNRCTFTGNWNGVDDMGFLCEYRDSIFWQNTAGGGISPGDRYELDILDGRLVEGCIIGGTIGDLQGTVDHEKNVFGGAAPDFDGDYRPRAPEYANVGYRPAPKSDASTSSNKTPGSTAAEDRDPTASTAR